MGTASLTWFIVSSVLQSDTPKEEEEPKKNTQKRVKEDPEPEDSSSSSDADNVKVKDEEVESRLLQSYPAEAGDAGVGSGLESAEARGIQKRRIHSPEDE